MRSFALVALALAGCGRYGFCNDGGAASTDAGADGGAQPNLVFVTSTKVMGTLGVAGADAVCTSAATSANLTGTFIAWLSTTTMNAVDRLAGARGWVRVDGAPVADTPNDLVTGAIYNPIDVDEHGIVIAPGSLVWTGTNEDGRANGFTCGDWTDPASNGLIGYGTAGYPYFTNGNNAQSCTSTQALYCFQTDHVVTVKPSASITGRRLFLGRVRGGADTSRAALDSLCQTDAQANGVPGTFLAAVATSTTSVLSRFTLDARPWQRPDGTTIATNGARLFDGSPLLSFVDQTASGSYDFDSGVFFVGAASPLVIGGNTCMDWSDTTGASTGDSGTAHDITDSFWTFGNAGCGSPYRVLCLEQ